MDFKMLKKLTLLSLVLLLLPFFQTCSDKELMRNSYLKDSPLHERSKPVEMVQDSVLLMLDSDSKEKEFQYTFDELKKKKQETVVRFLGIRNDYTKNGYQLGFQFVEEFKLNNFLESINPLSMPFFLILIITYFLAYFTFKKKTKIVLILSVLNVLFLTANLVIYYLSGILEDINQIKFGYYLFMVNSILIIIEVYKIRKKEKQSIS
jgi:hypothetical protein